MKYSEFQFVQPLLTRASFAMLHVDGEANKKVSVNVKKNILYLAGENRAIVSVTVSLNQREKTKERRDVPFEAEVEMQSIFTWSKGLGKEKVDKYLNQNATALLVSYIRPIISVLTASSPLPAYNLPFINTTSEAEN